MLVPDGGRMPTASYEGIEALSRLRRWIVGFSAAAVAAPASTKSAAKRSSRALDLAVADEGWLDAEPHLRCDEASWSQRSTPRGAHIEARLPQLPGLSACTTTGEQASQRIAELMRGAWPVLSNLSAEQVVAKLAEVREGHLQRAVIASGWSFMFSWDGSLYIFSAQLRPFGRSSSADDWAFLGAVMAGAGVPSKERDCILWTDVTDDEVSGVLKWAWKDVPS